jgi:hypothetical protein
MEYLLLRVPTLAARALVDLAEREYRDPRDQAVVLVLEGLRRRGLVPDATTAPAADDQPASMAAVK